MTPPRVLVVGGGFGGLEAAYDLRRRVGDRAAITIVSEHDQFLFKPNTIYVPFGKDPQDLLVPIPGPAAKKHIGFVQARAEGVDPQAKVLRTTAGPLDYDFLVLATGAAMRPEDLPGLREHANMIWTVDEMLRLRASYQQLLADARAGRRRRVLFLVPPNNKCAGPLYEMVLMLDTWLRRHGAREALDLAFATYERGYIQAFGPRLHDYVQGAFAERGIHGHLRHAAERVDAGRVRFAGGAALDFDLLVSFPAYVAATSFPGLPADGRGFVATDFATRQVQGQPDVYAVGDAGDFPVKQAFLALLQANAAAEHLAARLTHAVPGPGYRPVSMCIMEQSDRATFAQVPLRLTGNPEAPVEVDPALTAAYKVGTGKVWQMGKKMLGAAIPHAYAHGEPFHAGTSWAAMEAGLNLMKGVFAH